MVYIFLAIALVWCWLLQSTPHFSWFTWTLLNHSHPLGQAASPPWPTNSCISQCYATWPHKQATATNKPILCGGPPSLPRHTLSYAYPTIPQATYPGTPHQAHPSYPLEYPLMPVLIHGRLHWACDAEPSIKPTGSPRQSYGGCAASRARANHPLLAGQFQRQDTYLVT